MQARIAFHETSDALSAGRCALCMSEDYSALAVSRVLGGSSGG